MSLGTSPRAAYSAPAGPAGAGPASAPCAALMTRGPAVFSRFFIDRPIFAAVVSILIALAGGLALVNLPVAQYPEISPPAVTISIAYPGASAQVVADTVAAPIEQQVNGVPGMLYMSSN